MPPFVQTPETPKDPHQVERDNVLKEVEKSLAPELSKEEAGELVTKALENARYQERFGFGMFVAARNFILDTVLERIARRKETAKEKPKEKGEEKSIVITPLMRMEAKRRQINHDKNAEDDK